MAMSLKPVDFQTAVFTDRYARLHVEGPNHRNLRIALGRAAVAIGEIQNAVDDVAAERLVEDERRRAVGALRARVGDANPARGVHRPS